MKRFLQFLCGSYSNVDEENYISYQWINNGVLCPAMMQPKCDDKTVQNDLIGTVIAVLHNIEDEETRKTVKYVAITEEVYAKFLRTQEEYPFVKELPNDGGILPVEEIQHQIDNTINLDEAFIFVRNHIKGMGLDPIVAVEPSTETATGFQMAAIGVVEDVDWITALFYTLDCMAKLLTYADLRVAYNSKILIVCQKASTCMADHPFPENK